MQPGPRGVLGTGGPVPLVSVSVPAPFPTSKESYELDMELTDSSLKKDQIFRIYRAKLLDRKNETWPETVVIKIVDLEKSNPSSNADTLTDVQKEVHAHTCVHEVSACVCCCVLSVCV